MCIERNQGIGRCFFFLLCFWAAQVSALGQLPLLDYNREVWTTHDGLPHNTINNIHQDQDGYLYFASWEGAVRFDGRRFELYRREQLAGLSDSGILLLERLASGHMLFGGSRGGLVRVARHSAELLPKVNAAINDVYEDRLGQLWISTEGNGLFRISRDGELTQFRQELNISTFVTHDLHQTADDKMWLGTADGLLWFNPMLPQPRFQRVEVFAGMNVAAVTSNSQGHLLVGSEQGAYVFENQQFNLLDPALKGVRINKILVDYEENIWIGSFSDGVYRLSSLGLENLNVQGGLPNNKIYSLFQDREKSMWIGTNAGLMRLRVSPFRNLTTQKGLIDNYVRTLLVHSDGSEWIGTSAGLDKIQQGQMHRIEFSPALKVASFRSLAEGPDGDVWVGTYADGLIRLRQGKEIARYTRADGLGSNAVMSILPMRDGSVWIGTTSGLSLLQQQKIQTFHMLHGLPGEFIHSLKQAPDGAIWIGTSFGPALFIDQSIKALPLPHALGQKQVFDFYFEDTEPWIWMATDQGILRYDQAAQTFAIIDGRHGLPVEKFFSIQAEFQQPAAYFWFSSNRGVLRILKADLERVLAGTQSKLSRVEHFGELEGMLNPQCNGGSMPSALRHPDGSFWFATAMGVAQINPSQFSRFQPAPPPVVVQKIIADGQLLPEVEPTLVEGTRRVELQYSGMSFLMPGRLLFRTRLIGFEEEWVERGNQYLAEYTNLPPGAYEFQVMATYPDTAWPSHYSHFKFNVAAAWWQHRSLWGLGVVLLLLSSVFGYRWRIRQLSKNARYLTQQVQLQTRELQLQAEQLSLLVHEKSELVRQLQQQKIALEQQVRLDSLTGIANRRAFDEQLILECVRSVRLQQPLSFIMIDLDHFKQINDRFSHLAGDVLLKRFSAMLQQHIRDIDTVARWGGEEFALLLPNMPIEEAMGLANRLKQQLKRLDCTDIGQGLVLSASFGVAQLGLQGNSKQLIAQADAMLYQAKALGRDHVCG